MIDRAWDDKWSFNATYTLSCSKGNAEGPVNSDTDFADAGRTEAFDNPWVNYGALRLPAERSSSSVQAARRVRARRALGVRRARWACSPAARSARSATCNPFDDTCFYSFFIFNETTGADASCTSAARKADTPWLYDLGANVTYRHSFAVADLQREARGLQPAQPAARDRGRRVSELGSGRRCRLTASARGYQAPRYAQLTLKLDF